MFSPTTMKVSDVTYNADYPSLQTGKHLISGLVPGATYDISKEGTRIVSKAASSQGIIYFESTGGPTFRLHKTIDSAQPSSDKTVPLKPN